MTWNCKSNLFKQLDHAFVQVKYSTSRFDIQQSVSRAILTSCTITDTPHLCTSISVRSVSLFNISSARPPLSLAVRDGGG